MGKKSDYNTPARARLKPTLYTPWISRLLCSAIKQRLHQWDNALKNLEESQTTQLTQILKHADHTEFGHMHHFNEINDSHTFAKHVPINDYDSLLPFINRMRQGEKNLLVPEFVPYMGNSSGSSTQGKQKFLPLTKNHISHSQRQGLDVLARYLHHSNNTNFMCRYLLSFTPSTKLRKEGAVFITCNPALMMTKLPYLTKPIMLPNKDIHTIEDYNQKLKMIAQRYLDYDVQAITAITCWVPLIFEHVLQAARKRGMNVSTIGEIWPNLRVIFGGGIDDSAYRPIIYRLVGHENVTLINSYVATEGGIFATNDFSGAPGLLMLPHRGIFYEFVPLEEHDQPNPTRIPLWAVEPNKPYAILVTTAAGLYAYKLGDIVRFVETNPPRIEYMGRLSGCLSLTQELTTNIEIERSVEYACKQCNCSTVDFGAGCEVDFSEATKPRYVLYIEFDANNNPDLTKFAAAFDAGLCQQNRVYREHRQNNVAIHPATVVPLPIKFAHRFLEKITNKNVQAKFPRILDETRKKILDEFIADNQNANLQ